MHPEWTTTSALYSLNRQHLAAEPVIALTRLRDTLVQRLRDRLDTWAVPARYAALFGSAVRGDMRANSDLDLLLVRPSGLDQDDERWHQQLSELSADASAWTGNDARIFEYAEAKVGPDEPVLAAIADEGLRLHGPSTWLRLKLRPSQRESGAHQPPHG
jgi:predicted nucleotidyltransferase